MTAALLISIVMITANNGGKKFFMRKVCGVTVCFNFVEGFILAYAGFALSVTDAKGKEFSVDLLQVRIS